MPWGAWNHKLDDDNVFKLNMKSSSACSEHANNSDGLSVHQNYQI